MTPDQLKIVLAFYHRMLIDMDSVSQLDHARWMCEEAQRLDAEKANRWLGFIQGVLWCNGVYTIDEMREHNRNPEALPR